MSWFKTNKSNPSAKDCDNDGFGKESMPSVLKNPFKKSKVERVSVSFSRDLGTIDIFSSYGIVEFKNGNTSGEQRFRGKTFDEVVRQIKLFLENLD